MKIDEKLIFENFDVWTSVEKANLNSGRHSSNVNFEHYGTKKIRELVFHLAFRGLLTNQKPSDESVDKLFEKINLKKKKLIESGSLKKKKSLPAITDKEKPYSLPESWRWIRLPEIYYLISPGKKKIKTSDIQRSGKYPVVDQGQKFISGFSNDEKLVIGVPEPLIIFGDHTKNIKYIDFNFIPGADGTKILCPIVIFPSYFYNYLLHFDLEGRGYARHFKILNENLIAIPPLEEQYRIVAKIDELMEICNKLEQKKESTQEAKKLLLTSLLSSLTSLSAGKFEFTKSWKIIQENFDTLFTTERSVDQLEQTILKLAFMGKLIPQDPNDKNDITILESITKEKDQLIKEGIIKSGKSLPTISNNEKPFELPDNWVWLPLNDIGYNWGQIEPNKSFTYIDVSSINNERGIIFDPKVLAPEEAPSRARKIIKEGTVIYSTVRPYLLNVAVVDKTFNPTPIASTAFAIIHPFKVVLASYIYYYLRSPTFINYVKSCQTGIAYPAINDKQFFSGLIPIPPLKEQRRILSKLKKFIDLCEKLKENISKKQNTQIKLADSLVDEAFK
tara:strand:+ start:1087 stop:2769 length:1683 start_codon:yes stop_codon:yes gene_type:complete